MQLYASTSLQIRFDPIFSNSSRYQVKPTKLPVVQRVFVENHFCFGEGRIGDLHQAQRFEYRQRQTNTNWLQSVKGTIESKYIELADSPIKNSVLGAAVVGNGDLNLQEITDQTSLLETRDTTNHSVQAKTGDPDAHSSESPLKSEPLLSDEQILLDDDDSIKVEQRVYREVILVTVAIFMGYASLVVVQKKLYDQFEINKGGSLTDDEKELIEHGTSLNYIGNLCFRLLHNVVFAKVTPRYRVVISLVLMALSMSTLITMYFVAESQWVGWVYLSYLCGGVAIGSFESNLLSTITPLGPDTKVWAIIGMPVGFTCISVVGYAAMGWFDISVAWLYFVTAIMSILSIGIWLNRIPIPSSYNQQDFAQFWSNLKSWRQWFPHIISYSLCLTADMFMVSFFTAINQYILDGDTLPIFGGGSKPFINTNTFFSLYSMGTFIGDTAGRKIIYYFSLSRVHPACYLVISVIGGFLNLLKVPFLTWIGQFMIFLANGLIYAASTKFIDRNVNKMFSLTAISVWLFVGDIGSVTGSNTWQIFKPMVCSNTGDSKYFCTDA